MGVSQMFIALLAATLAFLIFKIAKFLYGEWSSPLRDLPGPPNPSFIYGNMKQIWNAVCNPEKVVKIRI